MNMNSFVETEAPPSSSLTISSVKRIHGRACLYLSNGEVLSMPRAMLKERPYRGGMPFDLTSHRTFLNERSYPFAIEKAVALLASRARTEKEIVDALRRNAYPETTIARVMQRLNEAGYVNDKEFAEHWAASRTNKGLGTRRIRMELYRKGVDPDDIDNVLSAVDQDEVFQGAVKSAEKAARGKDLSDPAARQRIIAYLARRGYDFSMARQAVEHILSQN